MCGAFFNHKAKDQYQDISYIVIIKNLVCYIYIKCEHDGCRFCVKARLLFLRNE